MHPLTRIFHNPKKQWKYKNINQTGVSHGKLTVKFLVQTPRTRHASPRLLGALAVPLLDLTQQHDPDRPAAKSANRVRNQTHVDAFRAAWNRLRPGSLLSCDTLSLFVFLSADPVKGSSACDSGGIVSR